MSAEENDPMVKNAIGFLKHPKVVSSGVAEKVAFLKKKGLTNQQIANAYIAIDKDSKEAADILEGKYDSATVPQSSASTPVTPAVAQPLQNQMNLPVNSQQYSGNQSTSIWTKLAYVFGGAALFGASGAAGFLAMVNLF